VASAAWSKQYGTCLVAQFKQKIGEVARILRAESENNMKKNE
jgi:hypothetical protein